MKILIPSIKFLVLLLLSTNLPAQTQIGQDLNGDNADACFGLPIALSGDGNTIAVSSAFCTDIDNRQVKVFRYDGNSWLQLGNIIEMPDIDNALGFPISISDDGNRLAITDLEYRDSLHPIILGRTQVFELSNDNWIQLGNDITGEPETTLVLEGIGMRLSGDGNHLVTIAPWSEYSPGQFGSARVFEFDGLDWVLKGDRIENNSSAAYLGNGVAISDNGNRIALAFGDINTSSVLRLYEHNGTTWEILGEQILDDNFNLQSENLEISEDGSRVAIRSRGNATLNIPGYVQVFEFENGIWSQLGADLIGDNFYDLFGASISLSDDGNTIGIGIPGLDHDTVPEIIGSVNVFNYDGNSWNQITSIAGEEFGGHFGRAISISDTGQRIAVGAYANDSNGADAGKVRIYEDLLILNTENNLLSEEELDFYPNPTTGQIFFNKENIELTIYTITGQIIHSYKNEIELDLSFLAQGTYIIEMKNPQNLITKKLIIK